MNLLFEVPWSLRPGNPLRALKFFSMEPQSDPSVEEKKEPMTPTAAMLMSFFGYPGVGQFLLGLKGLGLAIVLVFTALTLGLIYEMYITISPLLAAYSGGEALEKISDVKVNLPRIGFWLVSTGSLWFGSGVHAFTAAKKMQLAPPE